MKKGWIIYNHGLKDDRRFTDHVTWFVYAAKEYGISLESKKNTEVLFILTNTITYKNFEEEKPDFVIFFDKDIRLAQSLEIIGIKVFNSSKAIEICDDKTLTHIVLSSWNVRTPKTIVCPKTFFGFKKEDLLFLDEVCEQLSLPLVLKEGFGSAGNQVYLINNKKLLKAKVLELSNKPILFQEYIKESHGRDLRIYIVGGEFAGAVVRSNANDFRAYFNGGLMSAYSPNKKEIGIAKKACKVIGLDFAGVDILFGKDGPIICEVNSNAHMKNFYNLTGIDVVKKIFEHIIKNIPS